MKRRRKTLYIGDNRWKVQFCVLRDRRGDCNIEKREIRIDERLEGEELLEVLIHEIMHARCWDLDEQPVSETAVAAAHAAAIYGLLRKEE